MSSVTHLTRYDVVPYESYPVPVTHPANLATLAVLFGMTPPSVETARVLEIGCAAAGNLLPLAEQLPEARFLGIDLSSCEIEQGLATMGTLDLANLELRHAGIDDVGESWGKFDYIICHGVFSWVPAATRERLLSICSANLASNGVAYVSYNAYPGWHTRGIIRDMMCYRARGFSEPAQQVAAARGMLDLLIDMFQDSTDHYSQLLRSEAKLVHEVPDHYLFHDHLAEINHPLYFHEFNSAANGHGLQYLSEASAAAMVLHHPRADRAMRSIAADLVEMEQYMDFARNRSFRQTLLCHRDIPLVRAVGPARLAGMYLSFAAKSVGGSVSLAPGAAAEFRGPGDASISVSGSLAKAALLELSARWPATVRYEDLVQLACEAVGAAATDQASRALGNDLLRVYGVGMLSLSVCAPAYTTTPSRTPTASALARLQAARGPGPVTNRRHEMVQPTAAGRQLLPRLDGTRDASALSTSDLTVDQVHEIIRSLALQALLVK